MGLSLSDKQLKVLRDKMGLTPDKLAEMLDSIRSGNNKDTPNTDHMEPDNDPTSEVPKTEADSIYQMDIYIFAYVALFILIGKN